MGTTIVSVTLDQLVAETGWLRRLAGSLVKDQAAAEDLVHDTVLVAAEQAPCDGRPLRPWLARVLRNQARMRGRSAARRSRRERAVAELAVAPATPDEIVDRIELQRMLAGLVLELALPVRDVVLLHYFEGLSSAAIGNRLGIADGTVRWRLKQAIDELRDRLEQRAPNHAWVAPLARFAGVARGTGVAGANTVLLVAIGALLALVAVVVLAWQNLPGTATTAQRAHRAEPIAATVARVVHASPGADAMAPSLGSVPVDPDQHRITGVVVDHAGRPVESALVRINCGYEDQFQTGPVTVRTTSNGAFGLEVDRDCLLSVVASKDEAESRLEHGLFNRNGPRNPSESFVLRLTPTPVAVFKVVDADTGAPIAGARLSTDGFRGQAASAVSDTTGVARIRLGHASRLPRSSLRRYIQVSIDAPGYPSVSEKLTDSDGTHPEGPIGRTVRLVRGVPVSGRVVDPDGRGVANSFVVVEDAASWEPRVTDAAGAFSLAVPRAGRYRAQASQPGLMMRRRNAAHAVDIEVGAEGRTDVVLHPSSAPRGELTGTVVDSAGNPVAGARVLLRCTPRGSARCRSVGSAGGGAGRDSWGGAARSVTAAGGVSCATRA
jgi:RNA polymerase sigma-70 factor (ECF subfamily)